MPFTVTSQFGSIYTWLLTVLPKKGAKYKQERQATSLRDVEGWRRRSKRDRCFL